MLFRLNMQLSAVRQGLRFPAYCTLYYAANSDSAGP